MINHSNMMINPLNLNHLQKLKDTKQMITLNLEDGISKDRKGEALENISNFLRDRSDDNYIVIRTNPLSLGGLEEIKFLNNFDFDAIRVAKIKTQKDIDIISTLTDKSIHISVETKEAFSNLSSFRGVEVAYLGILDLISDLNLTQSILRLDNPTIDYILSKFLIDSHLASIVPFSFMYQDYNNVDEFEKWCKREKAMGFRYKATLGPKQVEIVDRVFGVSSQMIERARYIKEEFERNSKDGINGFMSIYGFIDEPIYRDSLIVLESIK